MVLTVRRGVRRGWWFGMRRTWWIGVVVGNGNEGLVRTG